MSLNVTVPPAGKLLGMLRKEHPRVMATAADFDRVRAAVAVEGSRAARWYGEVRAQAEAILAEPPSTYEIPDGKRLLATSRRVLDRVTTLAMVWHVSGDARFKDRAWAELAAAAAFKDWNPPHFLDTAEMTLAFGLGYDWLYHAWTDAERRTLREAIVRLGLEPGLACHTNRGKSNWWPRCSHNWNQVCNGGLVGGSLAIADEEPELAGRIIELGLASVQLPMREFAPDGAWAEGPGYWDYATSYNVYLLAALETALGTDLGLSDAEGFDETGLFPIHMTSPIGLTFAFADVHETMRFQSPQLLWLARRFRQGAYAAFQHARARPEALDLLWDAADPPPSATLPTARHFRGAEVVAMRSAWDDPQAVFVGLKGGSNAVNHSHLDLGSIVVDARGVRWLSDLGADNYNLPGYFAIRDQRWTYYRNRAESHNTLLVNPGQGPDQKTDAVAPITHFETFDGRSRATVDLSAAYADHGAWRVERTVELAGAEQVTVTDTVELAAPGEVWWLAHTAAEVTLSPDGRAATLRRDGQTLRAELASPAAARFTVGPASPLTTSPNPDGQKPNEGIQALAVHLEQVDRATLKVILRPQQ